MNGNEMEGGEVDRRVHLQRQSVSVCWDREGAAGGGSSFLWGEEREEAKKAAGASGEEVLVSSS
jgi:hypothetical protein